MEEWRQIMSDYSLSCPHQGGVAACNELFNRNGTMWRSLCCGYLQILPDKPAPTPPPALPFPFRRQQAALDTSLLRKSSEAVESPERCTCPPGTYHDNNLMYECYHCAAGSFAKNEESLSCETCPPGRTSEPGSATCLLPLELGGQGSCGTLRADKVMELKKKGLAPVSCD